MRILAIETSTMLGGLAIIDSDLGLIAERRLNVKSTHSERLMPELQDMLRIAGMDIEQLDAVAVSIGPGAFTGLRIGLAAAKGLAFSAGLTLVPVPTLEAMAYCLPHCAAPVAPMLDARKKQVYAALYDTSGVRPIALDSPRATEAGTFAAGLNQHKSIAFIGQGAKAYRAVIGQHYTGQAIFAPAHLMVPSPAAVAALGLIILKQDQLPDPIRLGPLYLRKSEAELKLK